MRKTPLVFTLLFLTAAAETAAQEVHAGISRAWTSSDLMGDPWGFEVGAEIPLAGRFRAGLAVEAYRDDFRSVGTTCVGLIPPDVDCSDETRLDDADMTTLSLALPVQVVSGDRIGLAIGPRLGISWVRSAQTGVDSGRTREASESMYLLGAGVSLEAYPFATPRAGLRIAASGARQAAHEPERIVDGYAPFAGSISRLSLVTAITIKL